MISFILYAIVFCILMCVISVIVYAPYHFIREFIRNILWRIGIDPYLEDEKVAKGIIPENRITKLQRDIEAQNDFNIPLGDQVNTLYQNFFPKRNSPRLIEAKYKKEVIPEEIEFIELPLIETKQILIKENKEDSDLDQLANSLEEINKKYSLKK